MNTDAAEKSGVNGLIFCFAIIALSSSWARAASAIPASVFLA